MRITGRLRAWNDGRGFGFIAPSQGGREVFVHITEFPRDGSRPTEGETLTYELAKSPDGKFHAVKVSRTALSASPGVMERAGSSPPSRSRFKTLVILTLLAAGAIAGYSRWTRHGVPAASQLPSSQPPVQFVLPATPPSPRFSCDGRTHCSQMTSCQEATFFLQNCPGTTMDGNHDGTPCEQQWCK